MMPTSLAKRRVQLAIAAAIVFIISLVYLGFRRDMPFTSHDLPYSKPTSSHESFEDVYNQTLGFEKILVINLPSRTDHRDAISLAAAVSDLKLDFIDGVKGADVLDKVLPPGEFKDPSEGSRGSWRAHMNAILHVVQQNLSTALIIEDDVDWDIRIRPQLRDFALSSRTLLQPLLSTPLLYADPTFPTPKFNPEIKNIPFENLPMTIRPLTSPYGDNWDVLWLGHCGMKFPKPDTTPNHPLGRVVHTNDLTVPEKQFIHFQWGTDTLKNDYPAHTRIVHHPADSVCSLAYAISQRGARRILYELGIHKFSANFDIMLREFCDGANDRIRGNCLTVQPQLFQHHRPRGARKGFSEIADHGKDYNENPYTKHIRWSVRLNFPKFLIGESDYIDQWPDGGEDNGLPS